MCRLCRVGNNVLSVLEEEFGAECRLEGAIFGQCLTLTFEIHDCVCFVVAMMVFKII